MKGYPAFVHSLTWILMLGLLISGLLILPGMLDLKFEIDVPFRLRGEWTLIMAASHALFAFLAVGLVGALLPVHIRLNLRRHIKRLSGFTLLGATSLLILTALGIYYFGDPDLSHLSSLIHTVVGLVMGLVFILHALNIGLSRLSSGPEAQ